MAAHVSWLASSDRRPYLAAYAGAAHGLDMKLRSRLARYCRNAAPTDCNFIDVERHSGVAEGSSGGGNNRHIVAYGRPLAGDRPCPERDAHWRVFADAYAASDFCLMPPGDSPSRQALFDALLCGCIPVFFATCVHPELVYETMYDPFMPRHERHRLGAGPWAVVLNATAIEHGQDASHGPHLWHLLRHVNVGTRRAMRRRIAAFASRLQYASGPLRQFQDAASVYASLAQHEYDRRVRRGG